MESAATVICDKRCALFANLAHGNKENLLPASEQRELARDARSRCFQFAEAVLKETKHFNERERFSELVLEGLARRIDSGLLILFAAFAQEGAGFHCSVWRDMISY